MVFDAFEKTFSKKLLNRSLLKWFNAVLIDKKRINYKEFFIFSNDHKLRPNQVLSNVFKKFNEELLKKTAVW